MSIPHVVLGSVKLTGSHLGVELEFKTNISHEEYREGKTPPTHVYVLSALDCWDFERQMNSTVLAHSVEIEAKWQEECERKKSDADE